MLDHNFLAKKKELVIKFLNNLKRNFEDFKTYLIQIDEFEQKNPDR